MADYQTPIKQLFENTSADAVYHALQEAYVLYTVYSNDNPELYEQVIFDLYELLKTMKAIKQQGK